MSGAPARNRCDTGRMGYSHDGVQHISANSGPDGFHPFNCGHCGAYNAGPVVAKVTSGMPNVLHRPVWVRCSGCGEPSAIDTTGVIHPGNALGVTVEGLPPDVASTYNEARRSLSAGAPTGCELVCRKLLMHVAVDKCNAKAGGSFESYVAALEKSEYITAPMRKWVDLIRQHANEATHQLPTPTTERAEGTLMFTAELLRIVYEMDHLAERYRPSLEESEEPPQA